MSNNVKLGVNIDHVATLRQARRAAYPDVVKAAHICEAAGACAITIHLRVDRRHIQDDDLYAIRNMITTRLNLELANEPEIVKHALAAKPHEVCLVPERIEEVTTEGGLDAAGQLQELQPTIARLQDAGIEVSLFIDPEPRQIEAAAKLNATYIELHTGSYSKLAGAGRDTELARIVAGAQLARDAGLIVNAGHGLRVDNVAPICRIPGMHVLNIGHSIVSDAVFIGLEGAIKAMLMAMASA